VWKAFLADRANVRSLRDLWISPFHDRVTVVRPHGRRRSAPRRRQIAWELGRDTWKYLQKRIL